METKWDAAKRRISQTKREHAKAVSQREEKSKERREIIAELAKMGVALEVR